MQNIFEVIKQKNIKYDTHCSDLYIPVTKETTQIINDYDFKCNVTTFRSQIDNRLFYDIPFAYTDYKRF